MAPGGGIPNLIGTGTVLVNGSSTTENRFGDYTSVSVDPSVSTGTVLSQNPKPGVQVSPGTGVSIVIGQRPPPPAQCP